MGLPAGQSMTSMAARPGFQSMPQRQLPQFPQQQRQQQMNPMLQALITRGKGLAQRAPIQQSVGQGAQRFNPQMPMRLPPQFMLQQVQQRARPMFQPPAPPMAPQVAGPMPGAATVPTIGPSGQTAVPGSDAWFGEGGQWHNGAFGADR